MLDTNDEMLTPIKATIGTKVRNVICEKKSNAQFYESTSENANPQFPHVYVVQIGTLGLCL